MKRAADYCLEAKNDLEFVLYTDAEHASGSDDVESTSGMLLALEGPKGFWPLCWGSKRQGAAARSTFKAEVIRLDAGFVRQALPTQELANMIFDTRLKLTCTQGNASVIQISKA